ncbi:MAG: DUF6805 domain-containing protein [Gemmatimonadaceae bacterium]
MSPVSTRVAIAVISLAFGAHSTAAKPFDRRIVDTVEVGNPVSETNHGYVGADATTGVTDGISYRQARGYMRYAMKTFDDTPLSVACTFVGSANESLNYELVVEDSVIATKTLKTPSVEPVVVEIAVPFAITKGRTNVAIIIRARDGMTPALRSLRTVQDHNELQQ